MISRRWHRWTRTKLNPARNRCAPGRPTVERLEERALLSSGAALDPTFGAAGLTLTDFGGVAFADAVAVQPDGKVLAAGGVRIDTGGFQIALARYNPDGALDAGFGSGGKVTAGPAHSARALAVQPDGKIVVAAGDAGPGSLARYNPDGSLDATFGTGGTAPLGWGGTFWNSPTA